MRRRARLGRGIVNVCVLGALLASACARDDDASLPPNITVTTLDLVAADPTPAEPVPDAPDPGPDEAAIVEEDLAAVVAFAELADLDTVVALDDNTVHVAYVDEDAERSGATHEVAPLGWAWSDGRYVFQWADVGDGTLVSTVAEFDGTVICEADGSIHHFEPADAESGSGDAMFVEASPIEWELPPDGDFAIPLNEVDCETGESERVAPVSFQAGDGFRFIRTSGPRTFTGERNTNGVTDLLTPDGRSINGDDAAIDHSFNADATLVAYGVFASDEDPSIVTDVIRMRSVDTGEILWTAELPVPFTFLHFADERVVIGLPDQGGPQGGASTDSVVILGARDGAQLGHLAMPFEILSVGG